MYTQTKFCAELKPRSRAAAQQYKRAPTSYIKDIAQRAEVRSFDQRHDLQLMAHEKDTYVDMQTKSRPPQN